MSPEYRPTKKERKAASKVEKAETAKKISLNRRIRNTSLALLAVVGIVGGGIWLKNTSNIESKPTQVPITSTTPLRDSLDLYRWGVKPVEGVDSFLVESILKVESSYTREDLSDISARQKHLELSAKTFAEYSGEEMPQEDLISSLTWLSDDEFDKKRGNSSAIAFTERETGKVYVRGKSLVMSSDFTFQNRKDAPYWSALSATRLNYWHEWYHRSGSINPRTLNSSPLSEKYFGKADSLLASGFAVDFKNSITNKQHSFTVLEEAFANDMTSYLEYKFTGKKMLFEIVDSSNENTTMHINIASNGLNELFEKKKSWIKDIQKLHRECDLLGFARLLADRSGANFDTTEERDDFGMSLIANLTSEDGQLFHKYVMALK